MFCEESSIISDRKKMTKYDFSDLNSPDPSKHTGGADGGVPPPIDFDWKKFVPPMPPLGNPDENPTPDSE